ncbi:Tail Collar domain protein [Anopheles sinensis]|uniref:Tail Collar domain protein n=1 Tax=Anopheles sinensis TaxID=74873 RepID=A0A084VMS5_ANOSI|nr:Tail Collar domain protein [Anopheles sinensis]
MNKETTVLSGLRPSVGYLDEKDAARATAFPLLEATHFTRSVNDGNQTDVPDLGLPGVSLTSYQKVAAVFSSVLCIYRGKKGSENPGSAFTTHHQLSNSPYPANPNPGCDETFSLAGKILVEKSFRLGCFCNKIEKPFGSWQPRKTSRGQSIDQAGLGGRCGTETSENSSQTRSSHGVDLRSAEDSEPKQTTSPHERVDSVCSLGELFPFRPKDTDCVVEGRRISARDLFPLLPLKATTHEHGGHARNNLRLIAPAINRESYILLDALPGASPTSSIADEGKIPCNVEEIVCHMTFWGARFGCRHACR